MFFIVEWAQPQCTKMRSTAICEIHIHLTSAIKLCIVGKCVLHNHTFSPRIQTQASTPSRPLECKIRDANVAFSQRVFDSRKRNILCCGTERESTHHKCSDRVRDKHSYIQIGEVVLVMMFFIVSVCVSWWNKFVVLAVRRRYTDGGDLHSFLDFRAV